MAIRLSGINSGLDTDALVKELVSAYSLKTEKYEKQKTKLEWKQEAWQSLNTKIYGLYTKVSNLQYDSSYNLKKTTVSDSTKASVTASGEAVTGTQKLSITSTAQACYITGGKLSDDIKGSTKLKELGVSGTSSITIDRTGSEDATIEISEDDTISSFMQKLRKNGLNANFDENNQRVYISAKESGENANFKLVATDDDVGVKTLISSLGLGAADEEVIQNIKDSAEAYKKDVLATDIYNVTKDADGNITAVEENSDKVKEYKDIVTKYEAVEKANARYNARNAVESIAEIADDKFTTDELLTVVNDGKDVTEFLSEKGIDITNEAVASHIDTLSKYSVEKYGKIDVTLDELETAKTDAETALGSISKDDYNNAVEALNVKTRVDSYGANVKDVALGRKTAEEALSSGGTATRIEGTDAKIVLNEVEYTSSSNSFNINGLAIEVYAESTDDITITTSTDTQGIYDKIKDFLTEYNTVINEITKLYNADSAKDYEPLTDDEKDAMSETEIEKWENKIKSALLRRDSSLGSVMNVMINSMAQTFEVDGQKLSLGNFGISTLGYLNAAENEQYAYHIDGDEDDASTSGKTDKLMAAIQTNPDQVVEFMKQLTTSLYNSIGEKMKSTELSSVYKVYNDKEMDDDLSDIEDLIEKWEEKVAEQEDYYYGKFSDMEVALSKLQSQTSALSGLLGS